MQLSQSRLLVGHDSLLVTSIVDSPAAGKEMTAPKIQTTWQMVSSCRHPSICAIQATPKLLLLPSKHLQQAGLTPVDKSHRKKTSPPTNLKRRASIILRALAALLKARTELIEPKGGATASKKYTTPS